MYPFQPHEMSEMSEGEYTESMSARIDVIYAVRAFRISGVELLPRRSALPFKRAATGRRKDCPVTGFPAQRLGLAGR